MVDGATEFDGEGLDESDDGPEEGCEADGMRLPEGLGGTLHRAILALRRQAAG